jgi:hypothetical protein
MSEADARTYVTEAVRMLRDNDFDPDDRAMLLATIAQAEATLAVLDRLKEGISLRHAEEISNAMIALARKLPSQ